MVKDLVAGLIAAVPAGALLYNVLAPARSVWHGDATKVLYVPRIQLTARTYLAFLLWAVPTFGAIGLIGLGILVGATFGKPNAAMATIGGFGIVLLAIGFPFTLVHLVVYEYIITESQPRVWAWRLRGRCALIRVTGLSLVPRTVRTLSSHSKISSVVLT